ncbi:cysteine proteinase inhibitor B-like [Durio zibethinus]|uniref:Cysteine proteinase inhibitor B-like n=1 Tax=Durio zibethinus TaxID=66656 RepID=A0A6P5Y4S1_DURZI|nr:cysteine proteinase inhibitor B-like [Durio zibethinus]
MATTDVIKILSLLLVIALSFTVVNGYGTMVGGKTEISDVKTDNEVQELGRFAVEEFNRSQGRFSSDGGVELVFSQVVEAQKRVVSGVKYYLKIEATLNGQTKTFDSVVVVKPSDESKEMLNFTPST